MVNKIMESEIYTWEKMLVRIFKKFDWFKYENTSHNSTQNMQQPSEVTRIIINKLQF